MSKYTCSDTCQGCSSCEFQGRTLPEILEHPDFVAVLNVYRASEYLTQEDMDVALEQLQRGYPFKTVADRLKDWEKVYAFEISVKTPSF